jgi:hypothetical protein
VGETTRDLRFVDMPPGTILLTPISTKIECQSQEFAGRFAFGRLRLPCDLEGVREAYLVCEYDAVDKDRKGLCCVTREIGGLNVC